MSKLLSEDETFSMWIHRPSIHNGDLRKQLADFAIAIQAEVLERAAMICDEVGDDRAIDAACEIRAMAKGEK